MPAGVKGCWCLGLWRYGLKVLGLEALEFRAPEVSRGFSGSMVLNMMIAVLLLVISDMVVAVCKWVSGARLSGNHTAPHCFGMKLINILV